MSEDDDDARAGYGQVAIATLDCVDAELIAAVEHFHEQSRQLYRLARAKGVDRAQSIALCAGAAAAGAALKR